MDDCALVKCADCGEYVPVPWELLGDTKPGDITDFRCGACEPDDYDPRGEAEYEDDEWPDDEFDDYDDDDIDF